MKTHLLLVVAPLLLASGLRAQAPVRQLQMPIERLRTNIEQITRGVDTNWGIYIKCLDTNEEVALNADQVMDTMSVIKIPLLVEAFRQIETGKFSLADRYSLKASDKRPGSGILRLLDEGASLTIKDLLTLMIVVSDNTATDIMWEKVGGLEPVTRLMHTYGFDTIRATTTAADWWKALAAVSNNRVVFHNQAKTPYGLSSPRDIGRLLEKIAAGEAVSKNASDQMIEMMNGQLYRTRLPKYLQGIQGLQYPHKTGDFVPFIVNDAGLLISAQRKTVIVVFTDKKNVPPNLPTNLMGPVIEDAIGRIAEQTANYFAYRSQ